MCTSLQCSASIKHRAILPLQAWALQPSRCYISHPSSLPRNTSATWQLPPPGAAVLVSHTPGAQTHQHTDTRALESKHVNRAQNGQNTVRTRRIHQHFPSAKWHKNLIKQIQNITSANSHARTRQTCKQNTLCDTREEERRYLPSSAWSRSKNELPGTCTREHAHSRPLFIYLFILHTRAHTSLTVGRGS